MRKAKDKYMINRNLYKSIKKYDHQQMEDFLTKVYQNGYKDGRDSGIAIEDVLETVKKTKGIGPVTVRKLTEAMENEFKEKDEAGRADRKDPV